ncbi:hypothetical protein DFH94DRAFT_789963 [Russula ochroleuca]|uniref:Uncharacterized protein n=1 Tax=Russula ochroleuca TaxID=152965 RepID=A0A9P5JTN4_9AGAM|nr:hypothetical protein DFH94DRAFT_789963 [Russula ochroleuca]
MSRRLFSSTLPRGISEVAREIRLLASPQQPPASEIRTLSPLHLPDVWTPSQHLMNMGLRPALARRLSSIYMDIVARYRQVFESYFRCAVSGSCHLNPEHYRDVFVVHFRGTVQVLASRMVSTAWVWLCQAGLPPTLFWPQCIDVHVDAETKAQILSRLRLRTTSFIMDATSNRVELPEETEGDFPTKILAPVPPPLRSTTPIRDLFHSESEKPSTCFPAYYPPPPKPISSPQKTLVTQFKLTPSTKNKKSFANYTVDVSSLTALLGKMSSTTSEAGLKTQENRKHAWALRSKEPEPSPHLSPVAANMSGISQSPNTEMVSSVKPITKPRKRRIAALPKRHIKTTALPTTDPSLPPAANPPVSRTPSLTSDTSSCSDSFSSSDELDTPPSTPPSHSHALIACNALSTGVISSKPNTRRPFGLPMFTSADFPVPRKKGIHIDFTNGEAVGVQQLSFTFGA